MDTTDAWIRWCARERLALRIATRTSCTSCFGAVSYDARGVPYRQCQHCRGYPAVLDDYVPICSSVDDGLESLLHRYKDFGAVHRWMAAPLAALTRDFLVRHLPCLERATGPFDIAISMPGNDGSRPFDHLQTVIALINGWPIPWERHLLTKAKDGRPGRGTADPSYYRISTHLPLSGLRILLFDDTWTSGASLVSAAGCLRDRGARSVVGLTIGRQLHTGFGNSEEVLAEARQSLFNISTCARCPPTSGGR